MKKILLVALMALCGVSFSFGDVGDCLDECQSDVVNKCMKDNCIDLIYSDRKYRACSSECIGKHHSPDTLNYCNAKCKK